MKKIIGARLWQSESADFLLNEISNLNYVFLDDENKYACIFLSKLKDFVESYSDDQDFGWQGIFYSSEKNEYVLAFDISSLQEMVG